MKILPGRRRGIALIIVLAMVTLLVALAVSLTGNARLDRASGSNHLEGSKARHAVTLALLDFIDNASANFVKAGAWNAYPNNELMVSAPYTGDPNDPVPAYDLAKLRSPEAQTFINSANRSAYLNALSANQNWVYIQNPEVDASSPGAYIARYFAVAQNDSGLLDFNAGFTNAVVRPGIARHGADLDLSDCFNLAPTVSQATAASNKTRFWRFDTYPDLWKNGFGDRSNSCFTVRSRYPDGYFEVSGGGPLTLPRLRLTNDVATLTARRGDIMARLILSGIPNSAVYPGQALLKPEQLYNSLLDYVDDDRQPQDLIASVENVPMLNEIFVSVRALSRTPAGPGQEDVVVDVQAWAELYYPFIGGPSATGQDVGKGRLDLAFDVKSVTSAAQVNMAVGGSTDDTFTPLSFKSYASPGKNFTVNVGAGSPVQLEIIFQKMQVLSSYQTGGSDVKVDEVANPPVTIKFPNINSAGTEFQFHAQAFDPRFNRVLDPAAAAMLTAPNGAAVRSWQVDVFPSSDPRAANTTRDAFNKYPRDILDAAANAGFFDDTSSECQAFVRNGKALDVAGELGYLAHEPWRTVRLITANATYPMHPVLDFFVVDHPGMNWVGGAANPTNQYRRGLINVNTRSREVLASAFKSMPYDRYPLEPVAASARLNTAQANAIADTIRLVTASTAYVHPSRVFDSPTLHAQLRSATFTGIQRGELARESLVRNAGEALGARNNLYTVLLVVQSLRMDRGGSAAVYRPVASERIVAQVWRDAVPSQPNPITPGSPQHPVQFVFLKNLYD